MMTTMLPLLISIFAKPLLATVEKYLLVGVMYAIGKGWIAGDAAAIAGAAYTVVSGVFTGLTTTQNAKVEDINNTKNGVLVVPTSEARRANIQPATEIIPPPVGSRD